MSRQTQSRRMFLKSAATAGLALTLATAPWPSTAVVHAQGASLVPIPTGLDIFRLPAAQSHLASGKGSLWVSGRFLNSFRNNLAWENLPPRLQTKYHFAGAEYKSMPAARGLWQSVPAPVRAAGPEAVWKFHQGKDWSHIVPRSVGGPATADNGVWWSSIKNRRLGPNEMTAADLADARAVLRSEAIRATLRLTLNGMVRGAIIGVVAGALLACLECGLEYAEGKITWAQMVEKVAKASLFAGLGGLVVAGLIVGIALLFPFIIPILAPLLFALQIVSLLFLGRHLFKLAQGWWEVLDGAGKLDDFRVILVNARNVMQDAFSELQEEGAGAILGWLEALVERVGADQVWAWIASRTQFTLEKAGEMTDTLSDWEGLLDFDTGTIGEAVARVVATEFEEALSTTEGLLDSIADYGSTANLKMSNSQFVA